MRQIRWTLECAGSSESGNTAGLRGQSEMKPWVLTKNRLVQKLSLIFLAGDLEVAVTSPYVHIYIYIIIYICICVCMYIYIYIYGKLT